MLNKYKIIGMSVFEKLILSVPEFEANRPAMSEFIERLAFQHIARCEEYGFTTAIEKVYIEEVSKYYSIVTGIPIEDFREKLLVLSPKHQQEDEKIVENKVILYPTFAHNRTNNGAIEHIPTMTAVALEHTGTITYLQGDKYRRIDTLEKITDNMNDIYQFVTDYYMEKLNIEQRYKDVIYKTISIAIENETETLAEKLKH